ncbi:hypothetical protein ACJJTC_013871 [Scirpophaga incertulas]
MWLDLSNLTVDPEMCGHKGETRVGDLRHCHFLFLPYLWLWLWATLRRCACNDHALGASCAWSQSPWQSGVRQAGPREAFEPRLRPLRRLLALGCQCMTINYIVMGLHRLLR